MNFNGGPCRSAVASPRFKYTAEGVPNGRPRCSDSPL